MPICHRHDLRILHNIVSAIAIHVHLNINKPLKYSMEPEDECPWPYLGKTFQYAGVSEDIK